MLTLIHYIALIAALTTCTNVTVRRKEKSGMERLHRFVMVWFSKEDTLSYRLAGFWILIIVGLMCCVGTAYAQQPGTLLVENLTGGIGIDWSPDGKWIAYQKDVDIYIISSSGKGTPINLTSTIEYNCTYPRFTPDSQRVMFTANNTPMRIESVDLRGDNLNVIIKEGENGNWNDDGTVFAYFSRGSNGEFKVMIYKPANKEYRVIYDGHVIHNHPPTFTSDGLSIVTTISDNEGNHSLFRVPLDGSQQIEQLNSGYSVSAAPNISPDGKWLIYYAVLVDSPLRIRDIRVIDMADGCDMPLYRTSYNLRMPTWSPDGSQIMYTASDAATPNSYSIYTDTFTGAANHGCVYANVKLDKDATLCSGITVLVHEGEKLVSSAKTNKQGTCRFNLLPGEYRIGPKKGQGINLTKELVQVVGARQCVQAEFRITPIELPEPLVRSMARYKSFKGYRDTTTIEEHIVKPGLDNRNTSSILFAFERPNRMRVESTIGTPGGVSLFNNGVKLVSYMRMLKQYTEENAPEALNPTILRMVRSIIAKNIIMSDDPLKDMKKGLVGAKKISSEKVGDISTTIIELTQPSSSMGMGMGAGVAGEDLLIQVRLWIGSTDYIIRKLAYELDMEQMVMSMPEDQRAMIGDYYKGMKMNVTEIHTGIEIDPFFSDKDFAFIPPEGAQLVDNFGLPSSARAAEPQLKGKPAPDFTLKNIEGTEVKLADYKGKVLIIDFWATWCGPCKVEIPTFIAMQSQYASKGFSMIGISVDEPLEKVKTFAADNKMNYPILIADKTIKGNYGGISVIPITFVIDKKGTIRETHVGVPSDMMVFQRKVEELLAE